MELSFKNVSLEYKGIKKKEVYKALDNINLEIDLLKDEFVCIVGHTGSGKSTLMQHINGLIFPTSGTVNVLDYTIYPNKRKNKKLNNLRKNVGYVFQFPEYQLFEETCLKDIMFAPLNFGLKKEETKSKAIEVSKILNIDDEILNKSPFSLSGGQMRKVAIAGILAYDPKIILLDEPTRGLDLKSQKEVLKLFDDYRKNHNKTIIMITHDMNTVYQYATKVIGLKDGKIVYNGDKLELFKKDIYKDLSLDKPEILKLVDYINENMNIKISYDNIYTIDDLYIKLKDVN